MYLQPDMEQVGQEKQQHMITNILHRAGLRVSHFCKSRNTEAIPLAGKKKGKLRLEFAKKYKNDKPTGFAKESKYTSLLVRHGGGSAMVQAFMASVVYRNILSDNSSCNKTMNANTLPAQQTSPGKNWESVKLAK